MSKGKESKMRNSTLILQILLLIIAQKITAKTEKSSSRNFDGLKTWKSSMDLLGQLLSTSKYEKIFGKTSLPKEDKKHEELLKVIKTVVNLVRYGNKPTSESKQQSILSKDCTKSFDDIIAQKNRKKVLQCKSRE